MTNKCRSNRGQVIVEFALLLPLLLALLLGILDFGVLFYDKVMITNASREGARAAIVFRGDSAGNFIPYTQPEIATVVNNYLNGRLISFHVAHTPQTTIPVNTSVSPGGQVRVQVRYTYNYLVIGRFFGWGPSIDIGADTSMRVE
jgi:Flp pilus assembly protein TadG